MIYEKYNKEFIAFGISLTGNQDKAMDLLQEAYISALDNEEMFECMNEYQIKGWFFTTMKNKNIDIIRKNSRLVSMVESDYIDYADKSQEFEESIIMNQFLNLLPEKYRTIIYLRYYHGLNSKEIGERLGISPSTVRTRLSKSLDILRKNI